MSSEFSAQDRALDGIGAALGDLEAMSRGMGAEIDEQRGTLDRMDRKAASAGVRLRRLNRAMPK